MPNDWTRQEVEATVADYLVMLASELAGVPYSKAAHRRELMKRLDGRTEQAIEFKHFNISAVLLDLGCSSIPGYKPRYNYQRLLYEVVADRLALDRQLQNAAAADADRPIVVPEVDDILAILTTPPAPGHTDPAVAQNIGPRTTNYLEREARNRSLGTAGEQFVLNYERARLIGLGKESLAATSWPFPRQTRSTIICTVYSTFARRRDCSR